MFTLFNPHREHQQTNFKGKEASTSVKQRQCLYRQGVTRAALSSQRRLRRLHRSDRPVPLGSDQFLSFVKRPEGRQRGHWPPGWPSVGTRTHDGTDCGRISCITLQVSVVCMPPSRHAPTPSFVSAAMAHVFLLWLGQSGLGWPARTRHPKERSHSLLRYQKTGYRVAWATKNNQKSFC